METKLLDFLNKSILADLLNDENVTDISFNGRSVFYQHNLYGRRKYERTFEPNDAISFVRQIANHSEKLFSVNEPTFDVNVGNLRIHAMHSSIVKNNGNKTVSFDIRKSTDYIRLDEEFFGGNSKDILLKALLTHNSIIISGLTGSGKTELQKFLISNLQSNERVIVIDFIDELSKLRSFDNLDITYWQIDQYNQVISIKSLIKNSLRSNPDWIVISEARGEEMQDILYSVMSGHPAITTIHSSNLFSIPNRVARMVGMSETKSSYSENLSDILTSFKYYVYLNKKTEKDGRISRFIESIGISNGEKIDLAYERKK